MYHYLKSLRNQQPLFIDVFGLLQKRTFLNSKKSISPSFSHKFLNHQSRRNYSSEHGISSVEEYEHEWVQFFKNAPDLFELQRGLNNCFGYDIVPTVPILKEALLSSRRLNDFPTSVRVLAGLRDKVENPNQYKLYLDSLKDVIDDLGISTPEDLGV